ncbi:MAG: hypothetical protein RBG1_1C00001G0617 [candidate division Zixibacteria bacterium RBG-1]|nr:MAG: hypothetical protein RBG1_1C00001G0617 [candidate division Zixibacteria bacterium RBG-1]OGC85855.1 MAG: glyoxalase [candidate division Zixibacteria bacterium RBG_19FT_COMBO_42_43]
MTVKPIPDGYHSVIPYLIVQGAAALIDFLRHAFDATEKERHAWPDGSIMHAEVKIGDSTIMLGEARGEWKPMPASIYLYVNDADATFRKAIKAGAVSVMEPADQFYGDRHGGVKDPCGNHWWVATHIEDVPPEELQKRMEEYIKKQAKS